MQDSSVSTVDAEKTSRLQGLKIGRRKRPQAWQGTMKKVTLVGNPNVGKSVIFGLLTGKYTTVSNYPGTTVEVSQGNVILGEERYLLVDTPGVNTLIPMSEDEKVTRDILLAERPHLVIQVGDSKNLKRTLLITIQLAEMGLPVLLDLNMEDEARDLGISIDRQRLSELTGIDTVVTVAPQRKGLRELRTALVKESSPSTVIDVRYGPAIEEYVEKVSGLLPDANISRRSIALMILAGDESLKGWLGSNLSPAAVEEIEYMREACQRRLNKPIGSAINEIRIKQATEITQAVMTKETQSGSSIADYIGRASMHPILGLPILAIVLFGLYEFVGVLGAGTLVDFFENVIFGEYLNPMFTKVFETILPIKILQEMFVGEYGIVTMALTYAIAIILPITTTFFIAFAILEDSGYLPRLAIMSNKVFNIMGLSGKAVLPMVLGLGCGTMAVMTTRILETKRDRIIATFLLALAVPCSAQLGVILGMLSALSAKAMAIWVGSVMGVLLFTGWLASKVVKGERSDFFLEIPPIRMPKASNVILKTLNRSVWYLKEAVPLFILGTLVLFVLDKIALLGVIERAAAPLVVSTLGLPKVTTAAFLIGFLRRDYGAAGLFALAQAGELTPIQSVVSLVTITLFVPCLAHLLMMIKERGLRLSMIVLAVIIPTAIAVGAILNLVLTKFGVAL